SPSGGADVLVGDSSDNNFDGLAGNDIINGLAGADFLVGGAGHDVLEGGDGNDVLVGNTDVFASEGDFLAGGNGSDQLFGEPTDTIVGGDGQDFLFAQNANPWTIDLGAASVEWMFAGFGDDHIDASSQTVGVTVFANGGNDTVTGSTHDDFL